MSNNYMNPPMASRNNCENFNGDQETWRNCNPGRNMGYYPYASNVSQQLMPDGQSKDDGSTVAEAGSTPPNKTVHDIELEKKYEGGDTETGESSGEEDWDKGQSKEKYMKILREASEARDEYSSKLKKLIGEVNRHRSKQFNKLDQALEVLIPPNLKEKTINSSLKQDRRLPLRRRLRPVITGINPKQQLQEITKSLGEDAVMLLVSIWGYVHK